MKIKCKNKNQLKTGFIFYYLYKYICGFCLAPFTFISKCKCGPVEFPVDPTAAIASPCATV